jgi:HD superfamily phosphohydrolase YqeK
MTLMEWSDALAVGSEERDRWRRAALLHDALKDAPPELQESLADVRWGSRNLLHGPAAAVLARRHGETDAGVLSAVRYHSVGFARWDRVGRMLYLADYLEPGRVGLSEEVPEIRRRVTADPDRALRDVARLRIVHHLHRAHPLLPETVAFWNTLI